MNILGNSIKEIRKSKKMTQKELAKLTGFKQNTISNHENGNRQLDEVDIRKYAKALKIEPQQLFDYSSSPTNPQVELIPSTLQKITSTSSQLEHKRQLNVLDYAETQLEQQNTVENSKDIVEEPQATYYTYNYYDHAASAGTGQYLNDVQVETIELPVDYDADFVIPVYGDSMEPTYLNGEVVLIKQTGFDCEGGIYAVEWDGQTYIKKVYREKDGLRLVSLNKKYNDKFAPFSEDPRIIGKIVGNFMPKEY